MHISKSHPHFKLLGVSCIIIILLLLVSPFLQILNREFQSKYYAVKNNLIGLEAHANILLVELDQESLDSIGKYPFKRGVYAQTIQNLSQYKPSLVAFDFLFLDPSDEQEDASLKASILENRVVL